MAERQFTGKHALAVFVAAFGVIIGVNLVLAYSAVKTFPGLEVKNSYVASQEFNERLQEQQALGWDVRAETKGGLLILHINDAQGAPVRVDQLQAVFPDRLQMRAAGDEGQLHAFDLRQTMGEITADGAGTENAYFHFFISADIIRTGCFGP